MTRVEVVKVPVPYQVSCLEPGSVPVLPLPTPIDLDKADQAQIVSAMGADLLALERYAIEVGPLLKRCAVVTAKPEAPQ